MGFSAIHTGNLNSETSKLYNPRLYYSITINGQLLISDILFDAEKRNFIQNFVFANTHGFSIKIEKEKLPIFKEFIQEKEREFDVEFDTF